jgi:RND family efflux transporter MFP subunit
MTSMVVAFVLSAACGPEGPPPMAESTGLTLTTSDVVEARVASLTDAVSVRGPLDPGRTVPIRTQLNAIVRAVHADRGSRVRRGQVLVELEAEGARGQAAGAKAAVAAAEANLSLVAQRLESARRLHDAGAISDLDLKGSETAFQAAEAQVAAARAQVATTTETESRSQIVSPIDGTVSDRAVEPGEAVRDGGLLMTVVDTRTLELRAQVGVDQAMKVKVGATVVFALDAASGRTFRGRVARVDPRADPLTRQVGVSSELPNANGTVVAGQYAHGRVLAGQPESMVSVPTGAVLDSAGQARVFVIEAGRLSRRDVTLGIRDDDQGLVGVRSGLRAGERVLARPSTGATDGMAVTMADDSTATRIVPPADSVGTRKS